MPREKNHTDTDRHTEIQARAGDLVADWPPLTTEQSDQLAVLLRPRPRGDRHAA